MVSFTENDKTLFRVSQVWISATPKLETERSRALSSGKDRCRRPSLQRDDQRIRNRTEEMPTFDRRKDGAKSYRINIASPKL
jgi:hypothetical protein